ncbi:DUF2141 domain-containing protein [Winogradskyella sp. PE311]|uniref:DUF2141 domain-containing protein n=1 Tax=Winogradskyella sp. PE311 TaxID=3366943 RepID=UPI00397FB9DB
MSTLVKIAVLLIINSFIVSAKEQNNYSIKVNIEEVKSNEGKVLIALYDAKQDFLSKSFKSTKGAITDNTCEFTFNNLPPGVYAVSIFHDENNNGKLDSNFLGIPKEDYGCSNGATGFMGRPKWEDAKFELKSDKTVTITL